MHLYRYTSSSYSDSEFFPLVVTSYLHLERYIVIKETLKGYWVNDMIRRRWVCKKGKKRFAYPTEKEALDAFICRKRRYISILRTQMEYATDALKLGEKEYSKL